LVFQCGVLLNSISENVLDSRAFFTIWAKEHRRNFLEAVYKFYSEENYLYADDNKTMA
jgi:hypothetical protein